MNEDKRFAEALALLLEEREDFLDACGEDKRAGASQSVCFFKAEIPLQSSWRATTKR